MATKRIASIFPLFTPFSQTIESRSSTPLTPFGIFVKSFNPTRFWLQLKVQLSVAVRCN